MSSKPVFAVYGGTYLRMKVLEEVELLLSGRVLSWDSKDLAQLPIPQKKEGLRYHEDPGRSLPGVRCAGLVPGSALASHPTQPHSVAVTAPLSLTCSQSRGANVLPITSPKPHRA